MASCEPFWMAFHNTEEVLDCPDDEGVSEIVPFMFPSQLTYYVVGEMVWGSPGVTPPWVPPWGGVVVSTDVGKGVVVCPQGTTMSIGPNEISRVGYESVMWFDPAEGISSESPLQVSGSDTGVFSVSVEDEFSKYNHHHEVFFAITRDGLRALLHLIDQEGKNVGLTFNKYVVFRNGVNTFTWGVVFAESNMYLRVELLIGDEVHLFSITDVIEASPEVNSATDLATIFLDGDGHLTMYDGFPAQVIGFSAEDYASTVTYLPSATGDHRIDQDVAILAPGPQYIGENLASPEEVVALLPPGANVTAQDVIDHRFTTVFENLGAGYRQPDGNGKLESVLVGVAWPGFWAYRRVVVTPEF